MFLILGMELSSVVRQKFYSTENVNLLKGVVKQFINDKHNTDVNENTYIFELKNVMENEYKNSATHGLFQHYRDSNVITKELNKFVIKRVIPSLQNKLFKKINVPLDQDQQNMKVIIIMQIHLLVMDLYHHPVI